MSVCTSSRRTLPTAAYRGRLKYEQRFALSQVKTACWVSLMYTVHSLKPVLLLLMLIIFHDLFKWQPVITLTLILQSMEQDSSRWPEAGNSRIPLTPCKTDRPMRNELLSGTFLNNAVKAENSDTSSNTSGWDLEDLENLFCHMYTGHKVCWQLFIKCEDKVTWYLYLESYYKECLTPNTKATLYHHFPLIM